MATAIPSAVISDIRGSIGTQTWSKNRGGLYVKLRKSPANPKTVPQQNSRAIIRNATAAWKALTNAQRFKYNVVCQYHTEQDRLGRVYKLSGFNLFVRQYTWCILTGAAAPTTIVEPIQGQFAFAVDVPINVGAWVLRWDGLQASSGTRLLIYGLKYRAPSRLGWNPSNARLLTYVNAPSGYSSIGLDALMNATLGNLGSFLGYITANGIRTVNILSGESSTLQFQQRVISTTPIPWLNT